MLSRRAATFSRVSSSSTCVVAAKQSTSVRFATALQSEKSQPHWSNKVIRKEAAHKYFSHPMYVMSREKILNKIWREHVLFSANWWYVTGFLAVAYSFKA